MRPALFLAGRPPIVELLDRLHRLLGDAGYAAVVTVFLLICLVVVIAVVVWAWLEGPQLWD